MRNPAWQASLAAGLVALLGAIMLTKSVHDSWDASQSADLLLVRDWVMLWFRDGRSAYDLSSANYPPHALVFLAPLAMPSAPVLVIAWSVLNALAALPTAALGWSLAHPRDRPFAPPWPTFLFGIWGGLAVGIKTGQFTLLVLAAGLLCVRLADRWPLLSGLLLALSLIKLHVGMAFVLWACFTLRWRVLAVAAGAVAAATVAFCFAVEQSLSVVLGGYGRSLWAYSGPSFVPGYLELRPLVHALIGPAPVAEAAHAALAGAAFVVLVLAVSRVRKRPAASRDLEVLALCAGWTLLVVFHNAYDTVLLLPAVILLWQGWRDRGPTARQDFRAFVVLQAGLILQVPTIWWRLNHWYGIDDPALLHATLPHVDRVLMLGAFAYLVARIRTADRGSPASTAEAS